MPGRKAKAQANEPQERSPGIEENFVRLEEIIKELEAGEHSLEETFAGYRKE